MAFSFLDETEPIAVGSAPGRFTGLLSDDWNAAVYPLGGIPAALAVRAMQQEIELPLRSVHILFVSPIAMGPCTVDVTVLRHGRTMSQATATVTTEAGPGLVATAAFGIERSGFEFGDTTMPELVPPERCRSYDDLADAGSFTLPSLWSRVEARVARGHAPWQSHEPHDPEQVIWYRFAHTPRDRHGAIEPSALLILADNMAGAISERVRTNSRWLAPSVDLTVRLLNPARSEWILARSRARESRNGYVSLENELWDPESGALIAHATQMAFYTILDRATTAEPRDADHISAMPR